MKVCPTCKVKKEGEGNYCQVCGSVLANIKETDIYVLVDCPRCNYQHKMQKNSLLTEHCPKCHNKLVNTHFDELKLPINCTSDEIKKQYRALAKVWHPDRNESPEAAATFKKIHEAYSILSDDNKRKNYLALIQTNFPEYINMPVTQESANPSPSPNQVSEEDRKKAQKDYDKGVQAGWEFALEASFLNKSKSYIKQYLVSYQFPEELADELATKAIKLKKRKARKRAFINLLGSVLLILIIGAAGFYLREKIHIDECKYLFILPVIKDGKKIVRNAWALVVGKIIN